MARTLPAALLLLALAGPARAESCRDEAAAWINRLDAPDPAPLLRQAERSCAFTARYLRRYPPANAEARRDFCETFALLWPHREACLYFRDDVLAAAYEPCKAWVQRMHERCLAGDDDWFGEETAPRN